MQKYEQTEIPKTLQNLAPVEYRRPLFQSLDVRFLSILAICILVESLLVLWLSGRPVDDYNEKEIAHIRERFASFILDERKQNEGEVEAEGAGTRAERSSDIGESGSEETGEEETMAASSEGSMERRTQKKLQSAADRQRSREAITEEVSQKGLLGLLTGTGSAAQGRAVTGIFFGDQGVKSSRDLDALLQSVDGLKTQSRGTTSGEYDIASASAKGGRTGGQATIDDLVADRESALSESISRQGDLMVESPADIIGRGKKSQGRSAQALQAVLYSHVQAIQYCYERELKRDPSLAGKISVRITVNPDGEVTNAEIVESTLNNSRVERCILSRIRLWKDFPPIDPEEGDVTFRQVYTFGS